MTHLLKILINFQLGTNVEGIQFFLNMTLSWAAVSDRVMCLQSTNFIFGFPLKGKNSFSSAGLLKLSSMVCDCKLM